MPLEETLKSALANAIAEAKAPGAVLYVGDRETTYLYEAMGLRQRQPRRRPAHRDTLYDVASLTKVVVTATAVMQLRDEGLVNLDQPITDFLPIPGFREMTIEHLLTHTAGLVGYERYYLEMDSMDAMLRRYAREGILDPPGKVHRYSDVGYMLLGRLVEVVARDALHAYAARRIFRPLDMERTAYNPPDEWKPNCAPTENDPWRGRIMLGEVHDENTYAVGGVSGHAGLFSTAEDLARFCRGFLNGEIVKPDTVREMTTMGHAPIYPWQGYGWQIDPWSSKVTGFLPSRSAFGHTGWTGTSIWIDPDKNLFVILLSNTCHPNRARRDNETLRRIVHQAVASEFYEGTNAHTGLDRLVRENFEAIDGRSYALLTNHAAVDQLGRHILDVLSLTDQGALKFLYSPEHGLKGRAEAGESIASTDGPVPVISLYGGQKEPTEEELSQLDLFVVDLQDVGARYYTYAATMKRCIAACARSRVPVLVLDRPNPVGGVIVEGPIAEETDSLVSASAVPIRHAMTMGELATWYATHDLRDLRPYVRVNYLDNWQPRRLFDECALPWIPPSPNMPDPATALLYVGMCLFEGVNVNEGRGTGTPFALVGAPWLDAEDVIAGIGEDDRRGCMLEATVYTPRSLPGIASNPKYQDTPCHGVRIQISEPRALRPFTLALALIQAMRTRHGDQFAWDSADTFDTLAGGPNLRQWIESGASAREIVANYERSLSIFDRIRPRLYDEDGIPVET